MLASDNPAQVQRAIDTLKQEEDAPGSTFTYGIQPQDRTTALKEGYGQLQAIQTRTRQNAEWQRTEEKRKREAVEKPRITDLTRQALNGALTIQALDAETQANITLAEDHGTYEHLRKLVSESSKDSPTDPVVYGRLWDRAVRGTLTVNEVLPHAGSNLSRKDAEHLLTVNSNRNMLDDDLFKAGLHDLEQAVKPPVGVVDQARWQRWSEASREYYDLARAAFTAGKRDQLMGLSRQVGDRWRNQAKSVTAVAPRDVIRHANPDDTRESAGQKTYDAWVSQYGHDKTKWPAAAVTEYNRQMRMIDQLPTAEQRRKAGEQQAQPTPQRGGRTTNPF
jgi:hypothetical protein